MATADTDSSEPMCRVMEIPDFGLIGANSFVTALADGLNIEVRMGGVFVAGTDAAPVQHQWQTDSLRQSASVATVIWAPCWFTALVQY